MIRSIIHTAGTRILSAIVLLLIVLICTNNLDAGVYGDIGLLMLNIALLSLVIDLFGGSPLVYYAPRHNNIQLLRIAYLFSVLVFLAGLILEKGLSFFPAIYDIIIPSQTGIHILVLSLLFSICNIHYNILLGRGKVKLYNLFFSVQILAMLISIIVCIYFLDIKTIWAYIISLYVAYGATAIISGIYVIQLRDKRAFSGYRALIREMFSFGSMSQLANLLQVLNRRLSFYFIKPMLGSAPLGIYNAGTQVSEGLKIIGQSISLVQFSVVSNKVGEDEYNKSLTLTLLKFTFILTLLALMVLLILPSDFYAMIFGKGYGEIKIVIICLSPGILALASSMIFSHYLSGTGRPKYNMIASLIGFIVTAAAIYPMVKFWGYAGAGLTTSFAFLAGAIYQFFVFRKVTGAVVSDFVINRTDFDLAKNIWTTIANRKKNT